MPAPVTILAYDLVTAGVKPCLFEVDAALVAGLGLGVIDSFGATRDMISPAGAYTPNRENVAVYERTFKVYKELYQSNRRHFHSLNKH